MNKNIDGNKNLSKNVMDGFKFEWGFGSIITYAGQIEKRIKAYKKKNKISANERIFLSGDDINLIIDELDRMTKHEKEIRLDVIKAIADNIKYGKQAGFFDRVFKKLIESDGILNSGHKNYKKNIKALIDFVVNNNFVQENIKKDIKKYNINVSDTINLLAENNNEFDDQTEILEYIDKKFSFDAFSKFVKDSNMNFDLDIDRFYDIIKSKKFIRNKDDFIKFLDLVKNKDDEQRLVKFRRPENVLIKIAELEIKLDGELIDHIVAFCSMTSPEDVYNMVFNNTLGKDENNKVKDANDKSIELKFDEGEMKKTFQIKGESKVKFTYEHVKNELLDKKIMTIDEVLYSILKGYVYTDNKKYMISFDKDLINEIIKPENNYVFSGKLMFDVMKKAKMIENQDDFAKFLRDCGSKVESLTLDELKDFYVKSFSFGKAIFNSVGNITKIISSVKKIYGNIDKLKNVDFSDSESIDELKNNLKEIKALYESGKNLYSKNLDNRKIAIKFAIDQLGKEKIFNQIFDAISHNFADSLVNKNDTERMKCIVKKNLSTVLEFIGKYIDKSEKDPLDNILDHADSLLNKYQNLLKALSGTNGKDVKNENKSKNSTQENYDSEIDFGEVAGSVKDLYSEVSKILITDQTSKEFKNIFTSALDDENIRHYVFDLIKPKTEGNMSEEEEKNLENQNTRLKNIFDKNLSNVVGFVKKYIETSGDDPVKKILDRADVIGPKVQDLLNILGGKDAEKGNDGQEPEKKNGVVKFFGSVKDLYSEVSKTLITDQTSKEFKNIFTSALDDENIRHYVFDLIKPKTEGNMSEEEKKNLENQNTRLKDIFDSTVSEFSKLMSDYVFKVNGDPIKEILSNVEEIAGKAEDFFAKLNSIGDKNKQNSETNEVEIQKVDGLTDKYLNDVLESAKALYGEVNKLPFMKNGMIENYKSLIVNTIENKNIHSYLFEMIKPALGSSKTVETVKPMFNNIIQSTTKLLKEYVAAEKNEDPIEQALGSDVVKEVIKFYGTVISMQRGNEFEEKSLTKTEIQNIINETKNLFNKIEDKIASSSNNNLKKAYKDLIITVLDQINSTNIDFVINDFILEKTQGSLPLLTTKLAKALFIKTINNIKTDIRRSDKPMTDLLNKMPDISGKTAGMILGSINSFNKTFSENKVALAFICLLEVIAVIPVTIGLGVVDGFQILGRYAKNRIEEKIGPMFKKNKVPKQKESNTNDI